MQMRLGLCKMGLTLNRQLLTIQAPVAADEQLSILVLNLVTCFQSTALADGHTEYQFPACIKFSLLCVMRSKIQIM